MGKPHPMSGRRANDHDGCEKCGGLCFVQPEEDVPWVPCPGPTGNVIVIRMFPEPVPLPHGAKALFTDLVNAADNGDGLTLGARRTKLICRLFGLKE